MDRFKLILTLTKKVKGIFRSAYGSECVKTQIEL